MSSELYHNRVPAAIFNQYEIKNNRSEKYYELPYEHSKENKQENSPPQREDGSEICPRETENETDTALFQR